MLKEKPLIRRAEKKDIDELLNIWLQASVKAHDFISSEFWETQIEEMRNIYLPKSETWIIESSGELLGFFSLLQDRLAAIFIRPKAQNQGIGRALIEKAKSLRQHLELTVYIANKKAINFYKKQGLIIVKEQIDPNTGHKELLMTWDISSHSS